LRWFGFRSNKVELYKIDEDLSEIKDLASSMPEKKEELLKVLKDWQKTIPQLNYGSKEKGPPRGKE
jgi:arylsulfatase A-like enzyme